MILQQKELILNIIHGSNKLIITITQDCTVESYNLTQTIAKTLGMYLHRGGTTIGTFMWEDSDRQTVIYTNGYPYEPTIILSLNIDLTGGFTIKKVDDDSNLIEGAQFYIWNDSGFEKTVTVSNGILEIDGLEAGTYYIQETIAPEGYVLDDTVYTVEVLVGEEAKDNIISIVNTKPTGTIIINKLVNLRDNIDKSLVSDISDLSDIQFKLTAKEDILDITNGNIIYSEGEEIGTYNLTCDGNLTIDNLPMGSYLLEEIKTLNGLVLNQEKYEILFSQEDKATKVYTVELNIENETTIVEINKQNIEGEQIEGATLQIIDESGNIVDEWTSEETSHKIEGLEIEKTYILHEEVCVNGYVKASDIEFIVENTNEIQTVTMIDKIVKISKIDYTTGDEIEGAKLQVMDNEGNIIDEWVSEAESHIVSGLEEGETYTLIEIAAPDGYEIADQIEFTVSYEKETQIVEIKNILLESNDITSIIQTGSRSNYVLLVTLAISSLMGIIIGFIILKVRKKNELAWINFDIDENNKI